MTPPPPSSVPPPPPSSPSASSFPDPDPDPAPDPAPDPDPAPAPHHCIEWLRLTGANFFPSLYIPFSPGLTVLIGGSGSGKTTSLQSLRFGLGRAATDPRAVHNEAHVVGTLGSGDVSVGVRTQHGVGYVSLRRVGEPARVTTESGEHAPVSLDGDLFKIDFFAQNEIFAMADSPAAQLALLDSFAASELRTLEERVAQTDRRLELNAAEMTRLEDDVQELLERTHELPSIAAALGALDETSGPHAGEARLAHAAKVLRGREVATLRVLAGDQRSVLAASHAFEADAARKLGADLAAPLAKSPNLAVLERARSQSASALAVVREAMARIRAALASAEGAVTEANDALAAIHAGQEATYDALVRRQDADRARIAERERLQRRFLELDLLGKALDERRAEHAARALERAAIQAERAALLAERFGVRRRVARELSEKLKGVLTIVVVSAGDTARYLALLAELLKGQSMRSEHLKQIARALRPADLAAAVRANDPSPLVAIDDAKTGKVERAQKILDALRATRRVGELEIVPLSDVPIITLRVGGRDILSSQLSTGQRCAAVLPILLLESVNPLVIDQPEDSLDSEFVFHVLVRALRRLRPTRQLIFASHNPNLVVLAGTDRVVYFKPVNDVGTLHSFGTVDEMRAVIEHAVEGGREAFLLRSKRYGYT